ncbi:MAG: hypothetical protein H6797_00970 [Candidatus Nomurabacteria bacterium]|nr:MAG: hypothetical protein H6797_00970 [Candidatus Nomurabacteria bacterium]
MKRVHKALKLRHHKHTGKFLHHRHTSYRVLFFLMLMPIGMLALVGQLVRASDYEVTASVPATIPRIAPVITSPASGLTTTNSQITVRGTCPLGHVAGIVAIYEGKKLLGAQPCTADGTFSVPITLSYGHHVLVATVMAITKEVGLSSSPLIVTREHPFSLTINTPLEPTPIIIKTDDPFIIIGSDGNATWKGSFKGGTRPYEVTVDWGDGSTSKYIGADTSEQVFSHHYAKQQAYTVIIKASDAKHNSVTLYSVALTQGLQQVAVVEGGMWTISPSLETVQRYLIYTYVITLSSLMFMWYLQHGRLLVWSVVRNKRHVRHRRPRSH